MSCKFCSNLNKQGNWMISGDSLYGNVGGKLTERVGLALYLHSDGDDCDDGLVALCAEVSTMQNRGVALFTSAVIKYCPFCGEKL